MGRSQETFHKKEIRNKKEKKRKEKEKKRLARKENDKSSFDDMIAYVDELGNITSTPPEEQEKSEVKLEDIQVGVPKKEESDESIAIRKGIVKFFNEDKGYGFIKDMNSQESIFVHVNNIEEPIKENNKVSFEVEKGPKGPTAVRVKVFR